MISPKILCCRFGRLVYVRTLKCASSFYYTNLTQHYNWQPEDYASINWKHDHVFGHLLDPTVRSLKAKVEYLIMHKLTHLIYYPEFLIMLRDLCFFDEHGYSYQDIYGDRCYQIDWIPLSIPPDILVDLPDDEYSRALYESSQQEYFNISIQHTQQLIAYYEPNHSNFNCWNTLFARPADKRMKQWYHLLYQNHQARGTDQTQIIEYLRYDIDLFTSVRQKFNPQGMMWPEMTWLR